MATAYVTVSAAPAKAETRRLMRIPREKDRVKLDRVLHFGFVGTVARAHVDTGSLKASIKERSERTKRTWRGEIEAGGVAPGGVNNPVDYAIYEKARGEDHDFFGNLHMTHEMYVKTLKEILAR